MSYNLSKSQKSPQNSWQDDRRSTADLFTQFFATYRASLPK